MKFLGYHSLKIYQPLISSLIKYKSLWLLPIQYALYYLYQLLILIRHHLNHFLLLILIKRKVLFVRDSLKFDSLNFVTIQAINLISILLAMAITPIRLLILTIINLILHFQLHPHLPLLLYVFCNFVLHHTSFISS